MAKLWAKIGCLEEGCCCLEILPVLVRMHHLKCALKIIVYVTDIVYADSIEYLAKYKRSLFYSDLTYNIYLFFEGGAHYEKLILF